MPVAHFSLASSLLFICFLRSIKKMSNIFAWKWSFILFIHTNTTHFDTKTQFIQNKTRQQQKNMSRRWKIRRNKMRFFFFFSKRIEMMDILFIDEGKYRYFHTCLSIDKNSAYAIKRKYSEIVSLFSLIRNNW